MIGLSKLNLATPSYDVFYSWKKKGWVRFQFSALHNPIFKMLLLNIIMKAETPLQMPLTSYVHAGCAFRKKSNKCQSLMLPILTDMIPNQNNKLTKKARYYANPGPLESPPRRFMAEKAVHSPLLPLFRDFSPSEMKIYISIFYIRKD